MRTGESETGLKACTYPVELRVPDTDYKVEEGEVVWVEEPTGGSSWRLVELRPVSEGTCRIKASHYTNLIFYDSCVTTCTHA